MFRDHPERRRRPGLPGLLAFYPDRDDDRRGLADSSWVRGVLRI